jgi:hypothetical protein
LGIEKDDRNKGGLMSNFSVGEYYRIEYSYLNSGDITYGGQNSALNTSKQILLTKIQECYDLFSKFDVRIQVLKVKVEYIPLEIKPKAIQFDLGLKED